MAFKYQQRSEQDVYERATRSSGLFDRMFNDDAPSAKFEVGDHTIRILPASWEGARHYGLTCWVHFDVGPDNQRYLCAEKMGKGRCAVCDEARVAVRKGDTDFAKKMRPSERVLFWVINRARGEEEKGPMLWLVSWGTDKDIAKLSVDRRTKKALFIDRPDTGYDVDFSVEKRKTPTASFNIPGNFSIARDPTPISDDARLQETWLAFVSAHPLPSVLKFYPPEHVEKVLGGVGASEDDPALVEEVTTRSSSRGSSRDSDDDEKDRKDFSDRLDGKTEPASRRASSRDEEAEDEPVRDEPRGRARREEDPPRRERSREDDPPARERDDPKDPRREDPPRARERSRTDDPEPRSRSREDDPPAREPSRRVRAEEPAPREARSEARSGRSERIREGLDGRKQQLGDEED